MAIVAMVAAAWTAAPTMQIAADARHLTVDLSGRRFLSSDEASYVSGARIAVTGSKPVL
jgi:hypothetical protein